ncbi:MAG: hypothetical protein LBT49_01340 [Prevotellaceae bacterium]|nr:hypothetical protein [Prevotellaceae bacterium]
MKKMFLLLLCCPVLLPAQSKITITEFSVKPGAPSTVTFTVSWTKNSIDSAWVFVDYNDSGTMTRLPLSDVTASAGRAYMVDGNDRGAWVVAGAAGAFSATVQLVATCRDARPCVPTGVCVYAIDYPPKAEYTAVDKIKFTGTPPFYLEFVGDSPATVSTKDAQGLYTYNSGSKTLKSFTDASGAPVVSKCALPAAQTLTVSAAGYCEGAAGVQFALSGTEIGATYQLIKDNTSVAATLTTTGGAATFSGSHHSGTYSAKTVAGAYCEVPMSGTHTVSVYAVPEAPMVNGASTACTSTNITATPGAGGAGIRWDDNSTTQSRMVTATGSYFAVTTSSAGCTSSSQSLGVTIYHLGTPGAPSAPCGCLDDLYECNYFCYTPATYTTNTDNCSPTCWHAYVAQTDICGNIINEKYGLYRNTTCKNAYNYTKAINFLLPGELPNYQGTANSYCRDELCIGTFVYAQYAFEYYPSGQTRMHITCYCCNK